MLDYIQRTEPMVGGVKQKCKKVKSKPGSKLLIELSLVFGPSVGHASISGGLRGCTLSLMLITLKHF